MRIADCGITIKNTDNKDKELGIVMGCIGGAVDLQIKEDGNVYYLDPSDIWNAFCDVMDKKEYRLKKKSKEAKKR